MSPARGERLGNGRYEVLGLLGEGGMQHVYEARDQTLSRRVALKVPKNASAERRFKRSAQLSARVNHPNVAKTLDYFEQGGSFFLVEELVEGLDLKKIRDQLPRVDPSTAASTLHRLAKAVAVSHAAGVVHRDLKPSNIMVVGGLDFRDLKVTDFGIAKMAEEELQAAQQDEETMTSSHTLMGALPYLSPEMIRSPRTAREPSDVWALGAIVYELLTGDKPFGSGLQVVQAVLGDKVPVLPSWILSHDQFSVLARQLSEILLRCLERDPARRPSAAELAELCGDLCYQTGSHRGGTIKRMLARTYGLIDAGDERPVFFHVHSLYRAQMPEPGTKVWFLSYPGYPFDRAHPVVPMAGSSDAPSTRAQQPAASPPPAVPGPGPSPGRNPYTLGHTPRGGFALDDDDVPF